MRKTTRLILLLAVPLMLHSAWARFADDESNYWQCASHDDQNKEWVVKSPYERVATNKALEACKNESKFPASCRVAKEYCEAFVHGETTRAMWVCTALDDQAKPWDSNPYAQQDDAALAALAYCKEQSETPASCYINLITCHNMNEKASR